MDANEETGDAFAVPDLWKPSSLGQNVSDASSFLLSFPHFEDFHQLFELSQHLKDVPDGPLGLNTLSLPVLETFEFLEESTVSLNTEVTPLETDETDIWTHENDESKLGTRRLHTWDAFEDPEAPDPQIFYISEAGPSVFDATIHEQSDFNIGDGRGPVLRSDIFVKSLFELGVGRSSVLFTWNEEDQSFERILDDSRMTGYSIQSVASLCDHFIEHGNNIRKLNSFVETTYGKYHSSPAQVALADAASNILTTLQFRLDDARKSIQTALQLQDLFHHPALLLSFLEEIVKAYKSEKSDEVFLSTLYSSVQNMEHKSMSFREIMLEVLARVSRPWLEFVGGWIGVHREISISPSSEERSTKFVRVEEKSWVDDRGIQVQGIDYTLDQSAIPNFVSAEDAKVIFETGRSLRTLKLHHPEHPLAKPASIEDPTAPKLDWKFSWEDVSRIEQKVEAYEQDLRRAIQKFSHPNADKTLLLGASELENQNHFETFGVSEEDIQAQISASIAALNKPLQPVSEAGSDTLRHLVISRMHAESTNHQHECIFAPPISLTPLLSLCPIISTQARLVNLSCIRSFFKSHHLRHHLQIQHRFHLLGDGVFASRLSDALFSPSTESSSRQPGIAHHGTAMGLHLGSRSSWPPASSELRLALMGILTESYRPSGHEGQGAHDPQPSSLPGDLSFSVRDMSPEELDRCLDPDSITALDFLRLQYKPPAPLEQIITPTSLVKYDRLFKLLLRAARMRFVVSQLFRDSCDRTSSWRGGSHTIEQRFRFEANHFVSTICGYLLEIGVGATWKLFEDKLDQIESRISREDGEATLGQHEGIDTLRTYHERVLDRMLFATLLRKRQEQVMGLLEEIFASILSFARQTRKRVEDPSASEAGVDEDIRALYGKFRARAGVFVGVCRGLGAKRGYGEGKRRERGGGAADELFGAEEMSEEGGNSIGLLSLRLEMSGFYTDTARV